MVRPLCIHPRENWSGASFIHSDHYNVNFLGSLREIHRNRRFALESSAVLLSILMQRSRDKSRTIAMRYNVAMRCFEGPGFEWGGLENARGTHKKTSSIRHNRRILQ